ncbi:MAG: ATP-dependent protease subunit HslV [Trueperaceae bacterium]
MVNRMHGTTIVAVNRDGVTAIAGDGQVTMGDTIVKRGAVKVRALSDGAVLAGFAGTVSDAFTLIEKYEGYLEQYRGNLVRAAVETVKEWRTDRALRNLEALLLIADSDQILTLSGMGDVIAPDDPVAAVGSGGAYAQAAALALLRHTDLSAEEIARRSLLIAAEIDIYTSGNPTVLTVGGADDGGANDDQDAAAGGPSAAESGDRSVNDAGTEEGGR